MRALRSAGSLCLVLVVGVGTPLLTSCDGTVHSDDARARHHRADRPGDQPHRPGGGAKPGKPHRPGKPAPHATPKPAPAPAPRTWLVTHVVDGDTVDLANGESVRLVGIDTPEVYGGVQCGGPQASRSLKKILPRGTKVSLVSDPSQALKDRYGRLLRYVHKVATGRDVNRQQVYRGWARVYVYDNKPFNRATSYRTAQRAADVANRGIWGRC